MPNSTIYCAGSTRAARYAAACLKDLGLHVTDEPGKDIRQLLLDVPSLGPDGQLRGGGSLEKLLQQLPKEVTVYGGKLRHPGLSKHKTVDFLEDPIYLAENAYITAECALDVALPYLNITLRRCPTLIIGWGRIGKCLGKLLKSIGADVTIAARKEADRAILHALGYHTVDSGQLTDTLGRYRLIFNTVPSPILMGGEFHSDCVKIELASADGIIGEDVIVARGLPGIHMPESSGKLIAETFIRMYQKEERL